ncbi:MAG: protein phosphatase 2C domain-containing protein [Gemmatimonadaceae bacterium]
MPDPKGPVIVDVFGRTDVGRTREHNEDAFVVADLTQDNPSLLPAVRTHQVGERGSLFMVADGMGGAAAGEIASAMAVDVVLEELRMRWLRGPQRDGESFASAIRAAATAANGKIHLYAGEHPELRGMGTTATIAGILGDTLFVGQVGDSRAYIVRAGTIRQITKDQSLIQKLVEAGELTEADAEQSDRRNIILQALGPEAVVRVDLTHQQLRRGDVLVLCSDGLSGQVKKEEIAEVVAAEPDLSRVCRELIDRANAAGGPDNITVVAARFDGDGLEPPTATDAVGHQVLTMPGDESQTPTLPVQRYVPRSAAAPAQQDATLAEPKPPSSTARQGGVTGRRVLLATTLTIAAAATILAVLRLMGAGSR